MTTLRWLPTALHGAGSEVAEFERDERALDRLEFDRRDAIPTRDDSDDCSASADTRHYLANECAELLAAIESQGTDCVDDDERGTDDATAVYDARVLVTAALRMLRGETYRDADCMGLAILGITEARR